MSSGLSHITLIVSDLEDTQRFLEVAFKARCVFRSDTTQLELTETRFYLVGDAWLATILGDPVPIRSYNHIAFQIDEAEIDARQADLMALGVEIQPARRRAIGEGRSLYFYGPDNHLFELHTGTLQQRLAAFAAQDDG